MPFSVEENETFNPFQVRFLGPQRIMLQANGFSDLGEQFRLARLWGEGYH